MPFRWFPKRPRRLAMNTQMLGKPFVCHIMNAISFRLLLRQGNHGVNPHFETVFCSCKGVYQLNCFTPGYTSVISQEPRLWTVAREFPRRC
jgi:hypothetical protein